MGAMRIGQIGSHIDLMGLYLLQQLPDRLHITFRHRKFLYLATLVERQIEEMDMIFSDMVVATGIAGLATTDQALHGEDGLIVPVSFFLLLQIIHYLTIADLYHLVGAVCKELVETVNEVHIEPYFLICHSNITGGLISDVNVVLLLHQTTDGAAHGDDIIIGMG